MEDNSADILNDSTTTIAARNINSSSDSELREVIVVNLNKDGWLLRWITGGSRRLPKSGRSQHVIATCAPVVESLRTAANKLAAQGYATPIYNGQGVTQWTAAGFPLVTTAPAMSPPCLEETMNVCMAVESPGGENDVAPVPCPFAAFNFLNLGEDICACFSENMLVSERSRGMVAMKDVTLGDELLVSDGAFEPVYMWGHRNETMKIRYLRLEPMGLELSPAHMVFVEGKGAIPASDVVVGGRLVTRETPGNGLVLAIQDVERQGVYAPFTKSGRLVVQNVSCSTYVAVIPGESGTYLGMSQHWMAHAFVLWSFHSRYFVTGEVVSDDAIFRALALVDAWWKLPNPVRMATFAPFAILLALVQLFESVLAAHFSIFATSFLVVGLYFMYLARGRSIS